MSPIVAWDLASWPLLPEVLLRILVLSGCNARPYLVAWKLISCSILLTSVLEDAMSNTSSAK
eukprot:4278125-Karenia_brevis.AAC.1